MRTRFSSNLPVVSPSNSSTSNPKRCNRRRSRQPFILEEYPIDTMADQRTMAELLRAPTEGYAEAIVVPPILEIAKLTHAVNQQTSVVTTAMTAILKQFQATPPLASVKAVEEICVTCGSAHSYYLCLTAGGNTFLELRDNIQGYLSAAVVNYNQEQSYQASTQQNQVPLNELEKVKRINEANMKSMQTKINIVKNELRNEMKNSIQASLSNQTNEIKNMMASLFQMNTASTLGSGSLPSNIVANPKGELKAITTRSEETLIDQDLSEYTIKVPPPPVQKYKPPSQRDFVMHQRDPLHPNIPYPSRMLKQKQHEKDEENCSAVILKKLPKKHGDPGKFLISCGFSELKCKALADLGASINLMPLSVWKKLAGIARDVFVPVGKFTFPANFIIVDYESDPRVPFILGRPFLQTAHALIDVYGEEMILRDDFLEDLFSTNQPSGNPTFSSHPELTLPKVKNDIFDPKGDNVLPKKLLDLDSTKDLYPLLHVNPLSGSTTYSFSPNQLLEEFTDELALITFPLKYDDDLQFDIEFDLKEIEYLLHHDHIKDIDSSLKDSIDQRNINDNHIDSMPKMFTDEHALDYSSPIIFDEYDDDLFEVESNTENVYDDPFDSKGEKIKEFKLLIDELDLPCDFLLPSEYDSFLSEDFSKVDAFPSTNNEDKVFNLGILIQENPFEIITRVVQDKKLAISNASLMLEDFDPPLYELPFFKEVPRLSIRESSRRIKNDSVKFKEKAKQGLFGNPKSSYVKIMSFSPNCQGQRHMARQCTQPKQPRNATRYKEKSMLAEAHEARKILDEEQLAFLADLGVPDGQAVQKIIPNNVSNVDWEKLIHIEMVKTVVEVKDCLDGLHLHGVRVVYDRHEADQSSLYENPS
nr:hypothetical protein [Tanacetum cinerariifolium]